MWFCEMVESGKLNICMETVRCLRSVVKLPSKKFQNLRCLRAWPHRCEPTRKWLADGLLIVKCWLGSSKLGCTTFGCLFAKAVVEQMAAMCRRGTSLPRALGTGEALETDLVRSWSRSTKNLSLPSRVCAKVLLCISCAANRNFASELILSGKSMLLRS